MGREIKSGEKALSDVEMEQMLDYARMVDGRAKLSTSSDKPIEHVRYSLTSPDGAKANAGRMRGALTDKDLKGRISFEFFDPTGKRILIRRAQLRRPASGRAAWLLY